MAETLSSGFVTSHARDGVGILTLNRPPQNRVTLKAFEDLVAGCRTHIHNGCRAIMFRADGPDFCLGGDFRTWKVLDTHEKRRERFMTSNALLNMIESLPVPTVTCVHGRAYGGGFELALHTDLIIAAESASFRFSELTLGVMPLAGGVQRLAERAGRTVAARMVMLSEEVSAPDALAMNLITKVLPDATHADECFRLCRELGQGPTRAQAMTKNLLAAWSTGGVRLADEVMLEHVANILVTEDAKRGITSATEAFEKGHERPPVDWTGN
ncbi:Carnitinyl-CoA dehydratase [Ruegeria sp. THAF57]|uniref:enoyl-CoA hydratase/isomerase family protein n=1 Tax=Ruegeria sp. THAF57 TaxID=2744555 RepID=UPI0015DFD827|nr:enoyl-CoA hydratase/isomerase family protein [Ruegeria sp. THAF57]CAD0187212.1 Carnitinyl-CoA dehydratase [Ruegeria sp. THAF57]